MHAGSKYASFCAIAKYKLSEHTYACTHTILDQACFLVGADNCNSYFNKHSVYVIVTVNSYVQYVCIIY